MSKEFYPIGNHIRRYLAFRNGLADEIIYAIILAKINVKPSGTLHAWLRDEYNCTAFDKGEVSPPH